MTLKLMGRGMLRRRLTVLGLALGGGLLFAGTLGAQGLVITAACYEEGTCFGEQTPEQKAKASEDAKRAKAKADADRREQERKDREYKAKVDVEVVRLGEHRRGDAERLVAMRDQAEAARPKQKTATPKSPPRTCSTSTTMQARTQTFPFMATDKRTYKEDGRKEMEGYVKSACQGGVMNTHACKGDGMVGFFNCKVTYTCPVKKTVCTGGPPAAKVSAE